MMGCWGILSLFSFFLFSLSFFVFFLFLCFGVGFVDVGMIAFCCWRWM